MTETHQVLVVKHGLEYVSKCADLSTRAAAHHGLTHFTARQAQRNCVCKCRCCVCNRRKFVPTLAETLAHLYRINTSTHPLLTQFYNFCTVIRALYLLGWMKGVGRILTWASAGRTASPTKLWKLPHFGAV